jgi:hypothetical protein
MPCSASNRWKCSPDLLMATLVRLRWPTLTRTAFRRTKDEMRGVFCDGRSEIHQLPCELRISSCVLQNR